MLSSTNEELDQQFSIFVVFVSFFFFLHPEHLSNTGPDIKQWVTTTVILMEYEYVLFPTPFPHEKKNSRLKEAQNQ